jgi:hypothetical protein
MRVNFARRRPRVCSKKEPFAFSRKKAPLRCDGGLSINKPRSGLISYF